MVTGAVGKLHSWSKEVDTTGGTAVMWDEKINEFNADPNAVLGERTHGWEDIWQRRNEEAIARANNAIQEAIKRAKGERGRRGNLHNGIKNRGDGKQLQEEYVRWTGLVGHKGDRTVCDGGPGQEVVGKV